MIMNMRNTRTGQTIQDNLRVVATFSGRFKGLMFTRTFPKYGGIIIKPCQGVHTFFMRYPIDVLLLDGENRVIYQKIMLRPNRMTPFIRGAKIAVEMPGGTLQERPVSLGDMLLLSDGG